MAVLKGERKDKNGLTYGLNQIALEASDVHQMKATTLDFHFAELKLTFSFYILFLQPLYISVQLIQNMIVRPLFFLKLS